MLLHIHKSRSTLGFKTLCTLIAVSFLLGEARVSYAQVFSSPAPSFILPNPGARMALSPAFNPPTLKGIKIFADNPFRFDFIVDQGDAPLDHDRLRAESTKLINYFLASLTIPETDLWVNLSPHEKDRVIPEKFAQTQMGQDLLIEDYFLKQLTASLMYPENELGAKFWERIHKQAYEQYGVTDIPTEAFNKVWIMPEKAVVYEDGDVAYVVESRLKVMLEQDYVALARSDAKTPRHQTPGSDHDSSHGVDSSGVLRGAVGSLSRGVDRSDPQSLVSQIIRDIILPALEEEVNTGTNFAQLRQITNALILATWYKRNLKESLLGRSYVGANKISGIDTQDKKVKEQVYEQYLTAFKQGVYDYIKEEYDPATQEVVARKYFSGGYFGANVDYALTSDPQTIFNSSSGALFHIETLVTPYDVKGRKKTSYSKKGVTKRSDKKIRQERERLNEKARKRWEKIKPKDNAMAPQESVDAAQMSEVAVQDDIFGLLSLSDKTETRARLSDALREKGLINGKGLIEDRDSLESATPTLVRQAMGNRVYAEYIYAGQLSENSSIPPHWVALDDFDLIDDGVLVQAAQDVRVDSFSSNEGSENSRKTVRGKRFERTPLPEGTTDEHISKLRPRLRKAAVLAYKEKLSDAELAEKLNIDIRTVADRLSKARAILPKIISGEILRDVPIKPLPEGTKKEHIMRLDPIYRDIVLLIFYDERMADYDEEKPFSEIVAGLLGISPSAVKSRLSGARAKLKEILKEESGVSDFVMDRLEEEGLLDEVSNDPQRKNSVVRAETEESGQKSSRPVHDQWSNRTIVLVVNLIDTFLKTHPYKENPQRDREILLRVMGIDPQMHNEMPLETQASLARQFGLNPSTVYYLVNEFRGWLRDIREGRVKKDDVIPKKPLSQEVEEAHVDLLPKKYKEVVELFHIRGQSYEQVSEELGIPVSTVRSRLFTARKLLEDIAAGKIKRLLPEGTTPEHIARLSRKQQKIIHWIAEENLSHQQIADNLGTTAATVQTALYRARQKLRAMIQKEADQAMSTLPQNMFDSSDEADDESFPSTKKRRELKKQLLPLLSSLDFLNKKGKVKDIDILKNMTSVYFRTHISGRVRSYYREAELSKKFIRPKGVDLHIFILRDLGFVDDKMWDQFIEELDRTPQERLLYKREEHRAILKAVLSDHNLLDPETGQIIDEDFFKRLITNLYQGSPARSVYDAYDQAKKDGYLPKDFPENEPLTKAIPVYLGLVEGDLWGSIQRSRQYNKVFSRESRKQAASNRRKKLPQAELEHVLKLRDSYWDIIFMAYGQSMSNQRMARVLKITPLGVSRKLSKAVEALEKIISGGIKEDIVSKRQTQKTPLPKGHEEYWDELSEKQRRALTLYYLDKGDLTYQEVADRLKEGEPDITTDKVRNRIFAARRKLGRLVSGEIVRIGHSRSELPKGYEDYMGLLSDMQRRVVTLFHEKNLSIREVADLVDLSEAGVNKSLAAARAKLREAVKAGSTSDAARLASDQKSLADETSALNFEGSKDQAMGVEGGEGYLYPQEWKEARTRLFIALKREGFLDSKDMIKDIKSLELVTRELIRVIIGSRSYGAYLGSQRENGISLEVLILIDLGFVSQNLLDQYSQNNEDSNDKTVKPTSRRQSIELGGNRGSGKLSVQANKSRRDLSLRGKVFQLGDKEKILVVDRVEKFFATHPDELNAEAKKQALLKLMGIDPETGEDIPEPTIKSLVDVEKGLSRSTLTRLKREFRNWTIAVSRGDVEVNTVIRRQQLQRNPLPAGTDKKHVLKLRPEYREVILLAYFDSRKMVNKEIAKELSVSVPTVVKRMAEGLSVLSQIVSGTIDRDEGDWDLDEQTRESIIESVELFFKNHPDEEDPERGQEILLRLMGIDPYMGENIPKEVAPALADEFGISVSPIYRIRDNYLAWKEGIDKGAIRSDQVIRRIRKGRKPLPEGVTKATALKLRPIFRDVVLLAYFDKRDLSNQEIADEINKDKKDDDKISESTAAARIFEGRKILEQIISGAIEKDEGHLELTEAEIKKIIESVDHFFLAHPDENNPEDERKVLLRSFGIHPATGKRIPVATIAVLSRMFRVSEAAISTLKKRYADWKNDVDNGNIELNQIHRRKRRARVSLPEGTTQNHIDQLSISHREIINLAYFHEPKLLDKEIADMLEISVGSARSRLVWARKVLGQIVADELKEASDAAMGVVNQDGLDISILVRDLKEATQAAVNRPDKAVLSATRIVLDESLTEWAKEVEDQFALKNSRSDNTKVRGKGSSQYRIPYHMLRRVQDYIKKGKKYRAANRAIWILERYSNDQYIWTLLTRALLNAEMFQEAMTVAEEAYQRFPQDVVVNASLVHAYLQVEDFQKSKEVAQRMYEDSVFFSRAEAHTALADVYFALDRSDEALWILEKARRRFADDSYDLMLIAISYFQNGLLEEANEVIQESLDIDPDSVFAKIIFSEIQGEMDKAEEKKRQRFKDLYANISELIQNEQFDIAVDLMDRDQGKYETDPFYWTLFVKVLKYAGRLAEATEVAENAFELFPEDYSVHNALAAIYLVTGRLEEATVIANNALLKFPDNKALRRTQKDTRRAIVKRGKSWEKTPFRLANQARALIKEGKEEEAIAVVEEAIERFSDDAYPYTVFMWTLYTLDRIDEAEDVGLSVLDRFSDEAAIYMALMSIYSLQGKVRDVIETGERAVSNIASFSYVSAGIFIMLMRAYIDAGAPDEALELVEQRSSRIANQYIINNLWVMALGENDLVREALDGKGVEYIRSDLRVRNPRKKRDQKKYVKELIERHQIGEADPVLSELRRMAKTSPEAKAYLESIQEDSAMASDERLTYGELARRVEGAQSFDTINRLRNIFKSGKWTDEQRRNLKAMFAKKEEILFSHSKSITPLPNRKTPLTSQKVRKNLGKKKRSSVRRQRTKHNERDKRELNQTAFKKGLSAFERLSTDDTAMLAQTVYLVKPTRMQYPDGYDDINEFMDLKRNAPDVELAIKQWEEMVRVLEEQGIDVVSVDQEEGQPDSVFAMNAGMSVIGKDGKEYFIVSRYRYPERQVETETDIARFKELGYEIIDLWKDTDLFWEAGGDMLRFGDRFLAGYGTGDGHWRSDREAHERVARILGLEDKFILLEMTKQKEDDRELYHLDTAIFPVDEKTILYYPDAFTDESRRRIEQMREEGITVIAVSQEDAMNFALNGVSVEKTIIWNEGVSGELKDTMRDLGFEIIELDMSEFLKAGGSVRCCILDLPVWIDPDLDLSEYVSTDQGLLSEAKKLIATAALVGIESIVDKVHDFFTDSDIKILEDYGRAPKGVRDNRALAAMNSLGRRLRKTKQANEVILTLGNSAASSAYKAFKGINPKEHHVDQTFLNMIFDGLRSENPFVGSAAVRILGWLGDERSVEPLIKAFIGSNFGKREFIQQKGLNRISHKGVSENTRQLIKLIRLVVIGRDDVLEEEELRQEAIAELGHLADRRALPILKAIAEGRFDSVKEVLPEYRMEFRKAAIMALGKIKDNTNIDFLAQINNSDLIEEIVSALGDLGAESEKIIFVLEKHLVHVLRSAQKGDDTADKVKWAYNQIWGLNHLSGISPEGMEQRYRDLLGNEEAGKGVKLMAYHVLELLEDDRRVVDLTNRAKESSIDENDSTDEAMTGALAVITTAIGVAVAIYLFRFGNQSVAKAEELLREYSLLDASSEYINKIVSSIKFLSRKKRFKAILDFALMLRATNPDEITDAVRDSLIEHKQEVLPALLRHVKAGRIDLNHIFMDVIDHIGRDGVIGRLVDELNSDDVLTVKKSIRALGWFADENLVEVLSVKLMHENNSIRQEAAGALRRIVQRGENLSLARLVKLLRQISSGYSGEKKEAIEELGDLGDSRAVSVLQMIIDGQSPYSDGTFAHNYVDQSSAFIALQQIDYGELIAPFMALINSSDEKMRRIGMEGLRGLDRLDLYGRDEVGEFVDSFLGDHPPQTLSKIAYLFREKKISNQRIISVLEYQLMHLLGFVDPENPDEELDEEVESTYVQIVLLYSNQGISKRGAIDLYKQMKLRGETPELADAIIERFSRDVPEASDNGTDNAMASDDDIESGSKISKTALAAGALAVGVGAAAVAAYQRRAVLHRAVLQKFSPNDHFNDKVKRKRAFQSIEFFGRHGFVEDINVLVPLLGKTGDPPFPSLRAGVKRALIQIGKRHPKEAVEVFSEILDKGEINKEHLAEVIGKVGGEQALDVLLGLLGQDEESVKAAAWGLTFLKDQKAIALLEEKLTDGVGGDVERSISLALYQLRRAQVQAQDGEDQAMTSPAAFSDVGGIDLNPQNFELQTQGQGIKLDWSNVDAPCLDEHVACSPRELEQFQTIPIEGLVPVILRVVPMTNLPMFLGLEKLSDDQVVSRGPWPVSRNLSLVDRRSLYKDSGYDIQTMNNNYRMRETGHERRFSVHERRVTGHICV